MMGLGYPGAGIVVAAALEDDAKLDEAKLEDATLDDKNRDELSTISSGSFGGGGVSNLSGITVLSARSQRQEGNQYILPDVLTILDPIEWNQDSRKVLVRDRRAVGKRQCC
jgi:hypothetical protein